MSFVLLNTILSHEHITFLNVNSGIIELDPILNSTLFLYANNNITFHLINIYNKYPTLKLPENRLLKFTLFVLPQKNITLTYDPVLCLPEITSSDPITLMGNFLYNYTFLSFDSGLTWCLLFDIIAALKNVGYRNTTRIINLKEFQIHQIYNTLTDEIYFDFI